MNITNINGLTVVSWCPVAEKENLLVTGSLAGTVQLDFASSATLVIYETTNAGEQTIVGAVETPDKFYKLTWGQHKEAEMGLIAGTMLDGTIGVWNPKVIIEEYKQKAENAAEGDVIVVTATETKSMITTLDGHDGGEVQALSFNNLEPGLLVSGGSDSKLNFYDLRNIANPSKMDIVQRTPHTGQNIVGVAWNKAYAEVLASCSMEGLCVIWDVKNKRHLVTFSSDQQKRKYRCVDWNPVTPTFVALASCDDENPVIEIWNLQVPNQPVRTLTGHTKGILSIHWCPFDDNLLLSGGKDGRTILWNPNTGEQLGELPQSGNWVYDVQWSYKASVLSVASYDKKLAVYSIQDATVGATQPSETIYQVAPKWLSRSVSAVFGFGGMLVSVDNSEGARISINRVQSDSVLPERASALFTALKSDSQEQYHSEKAAAASAQVAAALENLEDEEAAALLEDCNNSHIWNLMNVLSKENKNDGLLSLLGFNCETLKAKVKDEALFENAQEEADVQPAICSAEIRALLRECVITANWEAAVELCMNSKRYADALIFARKGSQSLYEVTQERYLQISSNAALSMMNSISTSLATYVAESDLSNWKETLAILCTFAKGEFVDLCFSLGQRLAEAKQATQAAFCYMCSNKYQNVLDIWVSEYLSVMNDSKHRVSPDEAALPLLEKFLMYQKTMNQKFSVTGSLKTAFIMLTVDLTTQGHIEDALWLASLVEDDDINMLKHRLYHSISQAPTEQEKPSTPWGKSSANFSGAMAQQALANARKAQQSTNVAPSGVTADPRLNTTQYINANNKQYVTPTPSGAVANFGISANLQNPNLYARNNPQMVPSAGNPAMMPPAGGMMAQPVQPVQPVQPNFAQPNFAQPNYPPKPLVPGQGVQSAAGSSGVTPKIVPPNTVTRSPSASSTTSSNASPNEQLKKTLSRSSGGASKQQSIDTLDFSVLSEENRLVCDSVLSGIRTAFGDGSNLSSGTALKYDWACKALVAVYEQLVAGSLSAPVLAFLVKLSGMIQERNFDEFKMLFRDLTSKHNAEIKGWSKGVKFLVQSLKN